MSKSTTRRRCSQRCVVVLAVGLVLTVAGSLVMRALVQRHEREIVQDQAESVAEAVRSVGEPILDAVTSAMVLAFEDDVEERFVAEMAPKLATYPLVRSVAVIEVTSEGITVLTQAGHDPVGMGQIDPDVVLESGGGLGNVEAITDDPDVLVFAGAFPVPGKPSRAVYGELAIYRDWLQLLAQDTARDVHLRYALQAPGLERMELYSTGGEPRGTGYTESIDFGGSDLIIEAFAIDGTIGSAEAVTPLIVAVLGVLVTALSVSIVHAMDRRRVEVDRLNVETQRLDAALEQRMRIEEELAHRAYHDPLTGLPNRSWLIERLNDEHEAAPTAIFFIDLDGFKVVNDSLGHEVGDRLLVTIAERLSEAMEHEIITRFGGDEFVIISVSATTQRELEDVASRIRSAVSPALHTGSGDVFVTASIGVRRLDVGSTDPEELLRDADAAMYAAKESGRNRHVIFHPLVRDRAVERLRLDTGMRRALDDDELHIEYQPIVPLVGGEVHSAEALVRWHHPERGVLMPDEFLPILAETTLLADLDDFVLRECARQHVAWREQGLDVRIAVNLSSTTIDRPDLVEWIAGIAEEHGVADGGLGIELTEKRLVDIADQGWIEQLRDRGIPVGIDDFGTGYSSIAYLRDLPVDFLKLDRSFVDPLGRDAKTGTIVRTLLSLATELGLTTVAEGVETEQQATVLRNFGCTYAQGTWFSPALDPDEFAHHVASRSPEPIAD